jgi:hypothetical protein
MGSEQAALLAAQNAGLGMGADFATLGAAGTAGGGMATPAGLGMKAAGLMGKVGKGLQGAQMLGNKPQQQPMTMPPRQTQNTSLLTIAGSEDEEKKRLLKMLLEGQA